MLGLNLAIIGPTRMRNSLFQRVGGNSGEDSLVLRLCAGRTERLCRIQVPSQQLSHDFAMVRRYARSSLYCEPGRRDE
jgi:hypothetical protein